MPFFCATLRDMKRVQKTIGRPSKLQAFADAAGMTVEGFVEELLNEPDTTARCAELGIDPSTPYQWMRRRGQSVRTVKRLKRRTS